MSNETDNQPKIAVSVEMKVNLGNYESAGAAIVLSGLHADSSEDEINDLLDTGKIAFDLMRARLQAKVGELRKGGDSLPEHHETKPVAPAAAPAPTPAPPPTTPVCNDCRGPS